MTKTAGRRSVFSWLLGPTLALLLSSALLWILTGYYFIDKLNRAYDARRQAQRIQIDALEMRRDEDEFFLQDVENPIFYRTGASENIRDQDEYYRSAIAQLDELRGRVPDTISSDIIRLRTVLENAHRTFATLVATYKQIGSSETGLKRELKSALDDMVREVDGKTTSAEFRLTVARLRLNEHPHFRSPFPVQETRSDLEKLRRQLGKRPGALEAFGRYERAFGAIQSLNEQIGDANRGLLKEFYTELNEDEPLVSKVVGAIEAHASKEKTKSYVLILAIFLAALATAVLLIVRLTRSISGPLGALKDKTVRFREDGEKATPTPSAIEEIHLLDESFCEMTRNLNKTQEQLLQSQKMESIGTLAGGIAHDFNNLLAGILAYAGLLKKQCGTNAKMTEAVETIERSAERGAELTRQLLGFARKGNYERTKFDVNKIILECRNLLYRTIDKTITIKADLGKELDMIEGDPGQILQTLMNLGVNARDAMPNGGELMFESQIVDADEHFCRTHGQLVPGRYVRISVSDTGTGMPKHVQEKIFDPFFTTKEVGKGTGLGLSMAYGIMQNHRGSISVYSEVGHGTQFHLYFPSASASASQPFVEEHAEIARDRLPRRLEGQMILIADDEALIRNIAKDILEPEGATLFFATNGQEALEFLETNHSLVNMVILDVIMPKMDGTRALQAIKKLYPDLPVILSSGYAESNAISRLRHDLGASFIQKPYKAKALIELIASKLEFDDTTKSQAA